MKKAWAVHLAEQQQKHQEGSDAEEEQKADEAVDPAEVQPPQTINQCIKCCAWSGSQHQHVQQPVMHLMLVRQAVRSWQALPELSKLSGPQDWLNAIASSRKRCTEHTTCVGEAALLQT